MTKKNNSVKGSSFLKKSIFIFFTILLTISLFSFVLADETDSNSIPLSVYEDYGLDQEERAAEIADEVLVGLYILNLGKFDIATGSFTADFYLSLKCQETQEECDLGNFEFMNGRTSTLDKIIDEPHEKFYRMQANLYSPVDLKQFPFDEQRMTIILEDKERTIDELVYIPLTEESGLDPSVPVIGWNIDGWKAEVSEHEYSIYDETYSQYQFTIDISRIALNSFIKTILPVVFIVLVLLSSFIIDPDKITSRLAMAGSSLVAAVMFHVSINNQIPPVGYLTFADKFMILTYLVLVVSFVMNIVLMELTERKNSELVEKIHRRTEFSVLILVPLLYLLLFIFWL